MMKSLTSLAASSLLLSLSSHAGHAEITDSCKAHQMTEYQVDEFTSEESTWFRYSDALNPSMEGLALPSGFRVRLGIADDGSVLLEMQFASTRRGWFLISESHPLRTLSSGKVFEHSVIPGARQADVIDWGYGPQILERQRYRADPEGVREWLLDSSTKFRIVGSDGFADRQMLGEAHRDLEDWARACLPRKYLPPYWDLPLARVNTGS